nr:MAG TPA: putative tail component [Caudoviricetes sp.]
MSDADELDKKLKQLAEIDMKRAVGEVIQIVRLAATLNCPIDTGELQQDIAADVEGDSIRAIGTCWTNKAYAPYVEFGTGPKGQADHAGISPDVTPVYTQSPWWIHESQVDRRVAEKYRWFYIDAPEGRFYQCTGQPAHPFMYPALHDNEDKILSNMTASFRAEIGKVLE